MKMQARRMNALSLFGFAAVGAMAVFYAFENRGPAFTLAFAFACVAASIYGFLAGTWPFGIIEALWALLALYRWRERIRVAASGGELRP